MSTQLRRAEEGVLGWIDRDITGPMADFQDPNQEWRRLFSEFYGTFLLVLVAAGGGMMSQAFPNTISRTAAVVAPGLMVMGVIMFMDKVSGAHLNPAVSFAFSLRALLGAAMAVGLAYVLRGPGGGVSGSGAGQGALDTEVKRPDQA